jgi:hypothetical protein
MIRRARCPARLVRAGPFSNGQTVNVAEQQSAELWPLLWPLGAALDALCTLGARAIRGIKRFLFAGFSHFSGKPQAIPESTYKTAALPLSFQV